MKLPTPRPQLFAAQESRLAALDQLARKLWLGGLIHSQGRLEPRLAGLVGLRQALLAGEIPAAGWPWPEALSAAIAAALLALRLPNYCFKQPDLCDTVVQSLLFHCDLLVDYQDRGASPEAAQAMAMEAFTEDWSERTGQIDELREVFGELPEEGDHLNWGQLPGLLRSTAWQEVVRIRRLLERLPELARLIRELGRAHPLEAQHRQLPTPVTIVQEALSQRPEQRTVRIPDMPGETQGIYRAGRIARMLPAEALLLGHPRLRLVWHARRAERTLLCYEDDDHLQQSSQQQAQQPLPQPSTAPNPQLGLGPILVCVDTSGSMQGGAEMVAKAVVLEAMRTAHAQGRGCHVFAFGGSDEVVDLELALNNDGITRLTYFLGQTFGGGTDICGPLERAIAKLEETRWRQADLLIASDGEFGATPELAARLDAIKENQGLRVQGVLVGDRETVGFLEVADHIYPLRDWRRLGGDNTAAPLPTHRLTALYFPGILRSAENRAATVSGSTAAEVVRSGSSCEPTPPRKSDS